MEKRINRLSWLGDMLYGWTAVLLAGAIVMAALGLYDTACVLWYLTLWVFVVVKGMRLYEVLFRLPGYSVLARIWLVFANLFFGGAALWILWECL